MAMNANDSKPSRRPSAYAKVPTEDLHRKLRTHRGMILAIERELARREDSEDPADE